MKVSHILRLTVLTLGLVLTLAVSAKAVSSEAAPDFTLTTLDGKTPGSGRLSGSSRLSSRSQGSNGSWNLFRPCQRAQRVWMNFWNAGF